MSEVFLSYSRQDRALAQRLVRDLEASGVTCWYDAKLSAGDEWREAIASAMSGAATAVLLVTPASLASNAVAAEWEQAVASSKRVVPVLAGGAEASDLPPLLQHIQAANWQSDYTALVRAIVDSATRWTPIYRRGRTRRLEYFEPRYDQLRQALLGASTRLDLAANSLDGLLRVFAEVLEESHRRSVRTRLIIPDPDYFAESTGGRNMELADRSSQSLGLLDANNSNSLAVRTVRHEISQVILRIDDEIFFQPIAESEELGFLVLSPSGAHADLYSTTEAILESLWVGARRVTPTYETRGDAELEREIGRRLESDDPQDFEVAADLYLGWVGFEVAATAQRQRPHEGFDRIVWSQHGPTLVEIKATRRPTQRSVVARLAQAATTRGANAALLITRSGLTSAALEDIAKLEVSGPLISVVSPAQMLSGELPPGWRKP